MLRRAPSGLLLGLLLLTACERTLQSGLQERRANHIVTLLHRQGLAADKQLERGSGADARYRVVVEAADLGPSLALLDPWLLSAPPQPGYQALYQQAGLIPTAAEASARERAALSGELAASLRRLPGVMDARIHLAYGAEPGAPLDARPRQATASALLLASPERPPDRQAAGKLLLSAVPGLTEQGLQIVTVPASVQAMPARPLARLGPLTVSAEDVPLLRGTLAGLLMLILLLAASLLALLNRARRARRAVPTQ